MNELREIDIKRFPLICVDDVVNFFRDQLTQGFQPNLTLLSIVLGMVEHSLTVNRPLEKNPRGRPVDRINLDGLERFEKCNHAIPPVELKEVRVMFEVFANLVISFVDLKGAPPKYTSAKLLKKVSDLLWTNLTKTFYKDKGHLQFLYTLFKEQKMDCFGMAFGVLSACQILGLEDVHLAISEDHVWAIHGEGGRLTSEITWHGKGTEDRRGHSIRSTAPEKSWLYAQAMQCSRQEEAALLVVAINPVVNSVLESIELTSIQKKILWMLYDLGHLNKYPMALSVLADVEDIMPTIEKPVNNEYNNKNNKNKNLNNNSNRNDVKSCVEPGEPGETGKMTKAMETQSCKKEDKECNLSTTPFFTSSTTPSFTSSTTTSATLSTTTSTTTSATSSTTTSATSTTTATSPSATLNSSITTTWNFTTTTSSAINPSTTTCSSSSRKRPSPISLYQQAVECSRAFHNDLLIYPHTYLANYHYRHRRFKLALRCWADAAHVASRYNYNREDDEIYREFQEIANEIIPSIIRTCCADATPATPGNTSSHSKKSKKKKTKRMAEEDNNESLENNSQSASLSATQASATTTTTTTEATATTTTTVSIAATTTPTTTATAGRHGRLLEDSECYSHILRFFDGLCCWEEGSCMPVLHIIWANNMSHTVSKFSPVARCNLRICTRQEEMEEEEEEEEEKMEQEEEKEMEEGRKKRSLTSKENLKEEKGKKKMDENEKKEEESGRDLKKEEEERRDLKEEEKRGIDLKEEEEGEEGVKKEEGEEGVKKEEKEGEEGENDKALKKLNGNSKTNIEEGDCRKSDEGRDDSKEEEGGGGEGGEKGFSHSDATFVAAVAEKKEEKEKNEKNYNSKLATVERGHKENKDEKINRKLPTRHRDTKHDMDMYKDTRAETQNCKHTDTHKHTDNKTRLLLRSEKMASMRELLSSERLNSSAIKLLLTAQSQVNCRSSSHLFSQPARLPGAAVARTGSSGSNKSFSAASGNSNPPRKRVRLSDG